MERLVRTGVTALAVCLTAALFTMGLLTGAAAATASVTDAGHPAAGPAPGATPAPGGTPGPGSTAAAPGAASGAANAAGTAGVPGTATGRAPTVVTFAWGGGNASQMPGLPLFSHYGFHGTYYVPSGLVCFPRRGVSCRKSQYLTLPDLRKIAAYGNEIGGLTVSHLHLGMLPAAEAARQICDDRVNLTRWGFTVTDFAYPYATQNRTEESLVRQCGYNSALSAGQTRGGGACQQCIYAETVPPADPMLIRAPVEVNSALSYHWTPATFEKAITGAQRHGGGWVVFLIHDICRSYCQYGITMPQLRQVLAWVHQRLGPDLQVKTVRQVIGGPVQRAVMGPAPRRAPGGGVANGSLADLARTGYPACFQPADFGHNTVSFSYQRGGGPYGYSTETLRLSGQGFGDAKLLVETDLGECAPPVIAGRAYVLGAWYKTSSPRTQFDVYYRNQIGAWQYWTSGPMLPVSSSWRQASWTTPPVPPGATGISFGLAVSAPGAVTTTGYTYVPAHPGRLKAFVLGVVALFALAPLLGWRLWHPRPRRDGPDGGGTGSSGGDDDGNAWALGEAEPSPVTGQARTRPG
jgi:peptidoglycan/xylan/chitin deacetylase (PgdA/CDA1 family)